MRVEKAHSHPLLLNGVQTKKENKRTKDKDQQLLGEKKKGFVYKIPSKRDNTVYVGEAWRKFEGKKKKKHEREVSLTYEDLKNGKLSAANGRMGNEDGVGGRMSK